MTSTLELEKPEVTIHQPNPLVQILERLHIREVSPWEVCDNVGRLYQLYPDLAGDFRTFDEGPSGFCQSWRGCPGWWKNYLSR